ncbi:hypothetical protein [Helicobacter enhydrae]|nr:hypothetical protein [Helicobacter enhydrae]
MPKQLLFLSTLLAIFIFSGCATQQVIFSQNKLCHHPITTLKIQNIIKKEGFATISQQEFASLLKEVILSTNCVTLTQDQNPSDGYVANIDYKVQIHNAEEKQTFSTKTQNTLQAIVTFNFSNEKELRKEVGTSTIVTEGKKILGMGDGASVDVNDEKNALKNSVLVVITNLIKSLQSEQTADQATSKDSQ